MPKLIETGTENLIPDSTTYLKCDNLPGSMTAASPQKCKVIFLGDESVGKTSIITRFMYDTFEPRCPSTIGIDFLTKTVMLDDRSVKLLLWDTAGQERFRGLIPGYIRESHMAIIVYDVTNHSSFLSTAHWIETVRRERNNDAVIVLVGNKTDLHDKRVVSTAEGQQEAERDGVMFVEASAKLGFNVKQLFRDAVSALPIVESRRQDDPAAASAGAAGFSAHDIFCPSFPPIFRCMSHPHPTPTPTHHHSSQYCGGSVAPATWWMCMLAPTVRAGTLPCACYHPCHVASIYYVLTQVPPKTTITHDTAADVRDINCFIATHHHQTSRGNSAPTHGRFSRMWWL